MINYSSIATGEPSPSKPGRGSSSIPDAGSLGTHGVPASKSAYMHRVPLDCRIRRPEYRVLDQSFQSSIAPYLEYPRDFSDRGVILYLGVVMNRTLNMNLGVHIDPGVPKTLGSSIPWGH